MKSKAAASQSCPIAVTGLGIVCALGTGVEQVWRAVGIGESGIGPLLSRVALRGAAVSCCVAQVPDVAQFGNAPTYCHGFALHAAQQALLSAALPSDLLSSRRVALLSGTTTGGIAASEQWYFRHLEGVQDQSTTALEYHPASTLSSYVTQQLGLRGVHYALTTACSSGANALLSAVDLLRADQADAVVAGGADQLCEMTYHGFGSLKLLSQQPCRPFDRDRDGLTLGEGAAFWVLERAEDATRRGAQVHAVLSGTACTCDAYHPTAPAPDGVRAIAAITQALHAAGLEAQQLRYVNAHGTGTLANDRAEAVVVRSVFRDKQPPVSSSKSFLGHTLGAAGAIEAVMTVLAVREGLLPATLNTSMPDGDAPSDLVLQHPRTADVPHALSSSFAFGGNNTALIFSRSDLL